MPRLGRSQAEKSARVQGTFIRPKQSRAYGHRQHIRSLPASVGSAFDPSNAQPRAVASLWNSFPSPSCLLLRRTICNVCARGAQRLSSPSWRLPNLPSRKDLENREKLAIRLVLSRYMPDCLRARQMNPHLWAARLDDTFRNCSRSGCVVNWRFTFGVARLCESVARFAMWMRQACSAAN